ncbi:glycosyltransferase family 4 protein [Nostoc sp.]|uniref:glycosyltransferase family 4 protein n=1 Tax=Nostoc sp. TaxID=1180 RepID=UPI002FF1285B
MKKSMLAVYTVGNIFSGQRFASEILIQGLHAKNWEIHVLNPPGFNRLEEKINLRWFFSIKIIELIFKILFVWFQVFLSEKETILYINLGQTKFALIREGFPILIRKIRYFNSPTVISLHGSWFMNWDYNSFESKLFRLYLNGADFITVLGTNHKEKALSLGIAEHQIFLMDNTCTLNQLSEQEVYVKHNLILQTYKKKTIVNVLFLSSLNEQKGYIEFINSITLLSESNNNIFVNAILCGKTTIGREKNLQLPTHETASVWIETQINYINKSDNAKLTWINGAVDLEKEKLFHDAHIFILPSRYEGQPITILEALASGCAIITTKVGEIPTTVNEKTVRFINECSPDVIKEVIIELSLDVEKRTQLALNGLRLFRERFSYDKHIDNWEKLLEKLIFKHF